MAVRKTAKWLSWEAVKIAVKGREVKSKGEKERYNHLEPDILESEVKWVCKLQLTKVV